MTKKRVAAMILLLLQLFAAVIGNVVFFNIFNVLASGDTEAIGVIITIPFGIIAYAVQAILFIVGSIIWSKVLSNKGERKAGDWVACSINIFAFVFSLDVFMIFLLM